MKCGPEFIRRVTEQAEIARRGVRNHTKSGQLIFTYGEVQWILSDLRRLSEYERYDKSLHPPPEPQGMFCPKCGFRHPPDGMCLE
jgi:hypothetical protein